MHKPDACHELDQKMEEMMKTQYRHRTYSEETGYHSELTPLSTPTKSTQIAFGGKSNQSDTKSVNFTEEAIFCQSQRALKPALEVEKEQKIYKVVEKLIDYRMKLSMNFGIRVFDDEIIAEEYATTFLADFGLRNAKGRRNAGWMYRKIIPVSDSFAIKGQRYMRKKKKPQSFCEFCCNNEAPGWQFHQCHNEDGKVVCPVLFKLVCGICGATGEYAHTQRYCPKGQRRAQKRIELNILKGHKAEGKY